jgi:hypothetical protein
MKKIIISNDIWSYSIKIDVNEIIKECSSRPNNREHWCLGLSLDFLKKYYKNGKNTVWFRN